MKTVLKSVIAGLAASFVLLSPVFFLPAYMVFSLIVLAGAQTQLHSKLWPYQLVENISLLVGMGILVFFIVAAAMSLYALVAGKWR